MMRPRVLLVDDDAAMRASTMQALDLAGLAVSGFGSAEEVLDHAGPGLNGVVLTDIRMPGMDGMTLLQRLRDLDPDLPVILITGHAEVQLAVEAMRCHVFQLEDAYFRVTNSSISPIKMHTASTFIGYR